MLLELSVKILAPLSVISDVSSNAAPPKEE